jgi:hypothetical protein
MANDNSPTPFVWDWRVPVDVEQAARAAEHGGMEPNTDFRKVPTKVGSTLIPAKKNEQDDVSNEVFTWNCSKPFKVGQNEYFYDYRRRSYFGPLCLVFSP